MSFNPYLYAVEGPREGMSQAPATALQSGSSEKRVSVLTPISLTIDLATVSGFDPPVVGVHYERDYFVMHDTQARVHRVHISASDPAQQSGFTMKLVSKDGQDVAELTDNRVYTVLPIQTDVVDDTFPSFTGALFVRVKTTSQNVLLYVTIEVLTGKVL